MPPSPALACPAPEQHNQGRKRAGGWVAGSQQTKQEELGGKGGEGKSETPELVTQHQLFLHKSVAAPHGN